MGINVSEGFTALDGALHTKTRNIIADRLKKLYSSGHYKVKQYVHNTLLRCGVEESDIHGIISKLNNPMDHSIEKNFVLDVLAQPLRSRRNYEALGIYVMNNALKYSGMRVEKLPNTGDKAYVMLTDGRVEQIGQLKLHHTDKEIADMVKTRVGTIDAFMTMPDPDGRNVWITLKHMRQQGGYQDNGIHEVDSFIDGASSATSDDIFCTVMEGDYGRKSGTLRESKNSISGDAVHVAEALLTRMGQTIHPSVDPYHISDAFIKDLVCNSIPDKSVIVSKEMNDVLANAVNKELEKFRSMSSAERSKIIRGKLVNLHMSDVDDEYVSTVAEMLSTPDGSVYSKIMFNYLIPNPERKKIYESDFIDKCNSLGFNIEKLDETGKDSLYLHTGRIVNNAEYEELKRFYSNGMTTKSLDFKIDTNGVQIYGFHKFSTSKGTEVDESFDFVSYVKEWARNSENRDRYLSMVLEGPAMDKFTIHSIRESARDLNGHHYKNIIIGDRESVMKSLAMITGLSVDTVDKCPDITRHEVDDTQDKSVQQEHHMDM